MSDKRKRYFDPAPEKTIPTKVKVSKRTKNEFHSKTANLLSIIKNKGDHKDIVEVTADITQNYRKNNFNKYKLDKQMHTLKTPAQPKFPGKAPISKEKLEKHSRGKGIDGRGIKHPLHLKKLERKEKHIQFATEQAARAELLLTENTGFLEADDGETTTQFTQKQIAASVDIAAAAKSFELHLQQFGPYRMKYSRNGRHLLLGGKMGHVAAFDWVTKHLHCEINVMETVHDICWMHIETMFAVAQKDWVYMYDNKGTEVHCVKTLNKVLRMEFLPYHFLLGTASELGYLSWLDISIGQMVGQYRTGLGKVSIMKQNPYNATLCVGQSKGVVSMWAPKVKNPLASMLCHKAPLSALAIDPRGVYMATSAIDRSVKIWDIRNLQGPLQKYNLRSAATHLEFSQNNLLAVGMGNVVEIYRDCCTQTASKAYLQHRMNAYIGNMNFCPYEDVLGVATDKGFVSLLVPGSGEANFDALESNPYQSKSQRREAEVKSLLEKIQPEMIALNPAAIADVNLPSLKEKMEARSKLRHLKPQNIDYRPRNKTKNKGTAKISRNKKIVQEAAKREFYKNMKEVRKPFDKNVVKETKSFGVLDRFVRKVKK